MLNTISYITQEWALKLGTHIQMKQTLNKTD